MRALRLRQPAPVEAEPIEPCEVEPPRPGPGEFLVSVDVCAFRGSAVLQASD